MVKTRKMAMVKEMITHDRLTRSSVKSRQLRTCRGQVFKTANSSSTKKNLRKQMNKQYINKIDSNVKLVKQVSFASPENVIRTPAEKFSQQKSILDTDCLEVTNNEIGSSEEAQVRMDIQSQESNDHDTFHRKIKPTDGFDDSVEENNDALVSSDKESNDNIKNCESKNELQEAVMPKLAIQKNISQLTNNQEDHSYAKEVLPKTNEDKSVSPSSAKEINVAVFDCVKASDKPKQKKERSNSKKTKKELVVVSKGSGTVMFKNSEVTLKLNTGMSSEKPAEGIGVDCPYCNKVCNTFEQYRNHLRSHDRGNTYCKKNGPISHYKESVKSFSSLNTEEKPFSCKICDATFRHESSLKFHMRKHGNKSNYKCVNCNRRFSTNKYMKKHMKENCGRAKHLCPICSEDFRSKSALQKHKVEEHSAGSKRDETTVHGLKRTYKCLECNQMYPDKEKAKQHQSEVHHETAKDAESGLEIINVVSDGGDMKDDEQEEQEDEESLTEFEDNATDPDYMPSNESSNDDSDDEINSDSSCKNIKPGGDDIPLIQSTVNSKTVNYLEAVKPIVIRKTLPLNASKIDQVLAKYPVLMPRPVFSKSPEENCNTKDVKKSRCNLNVRKKKVTVKDKTLKESDHSENLVVRSDGSLQSLKDQVRGDLKRPSVTVTVNGASCTLPLVVTENEIFESAASLKQQIDKTKKTVSEQKTSSSPKKVNKVFVKKVPRDVIKKLQTAVRKRQTRKLTETSSKRTDTHRKIRKKRERAATVCKVIGRRKRKAQSTIVEGPCSETNFPNESPQEKVKRLLARLPVIVPKSNLLPLPDNTNSNPLILPVSDVTSYDQLSEKRLPSSSGVLPLSAKTLGPGVPSSFVDDSHVTLTTQSSDVWKNHNQSIQNQHSVSRESMDNLALKKSNQILVRDRENVSGSEGCIDTYDMIGNVAEATRSVRLCLSSICEESAKDKTSLANKSNQTSTVSETTKVCESKTFESGLQFVEPNSKDEMPCIITNVISLNPSNNIHLMSENAPKNTCGPAAEEISQLEPCVESRPLVNQKSVESVAHNSDSRKRTMNFEGTPERDQVVYQQKLSFDKIKINSSSTNTPSICMSNSNARTISKDEVTVHSSQPNQSSPLVSVTSQQENVPLTVHQDININPTKQHWNYKDFQSYPNKVKYPKPFQIRQKKYFTTVSRRYRPLLPKPGPSESHQLTSEWMQNTHYREQLQQTPNRQEETHLEKQEENSCPLVEGAKESGFHFSSTSGNNSHSINPVSSCDVAAVSNSDNNIRVFADNREFSKQSTSPNVKDNDNVALYPSFNHSFSSLVRPSSVTVNGDDVLKSQLPSFSTPSARQNIFPRSNSSRVSGYDNGLHEPIGKTIAVSQPQVTSEDSASRKTAVSKPASSQKLIILGDYTEPFYSMYSKCNSIDVSSKEKSSRSHVTVTSCNGLPLAHPSNIEGQSSVSRQRLSGLANTQEGAFKVSGHLDNPASSTGKQSKTYIKDNLSSFAQHPTFNAEETNRGCDSRFRPNNCLIQENGSSKKKNVTNSKELSVHLRSFVGSINQQTYSQYARKLGGPQIRPLMPRPSTPQNAQRQNVSSFVPSTDQGNSRSLVISADTPLAEGVLKTKNVSCSGTSDFTPLYAHNNVYIRPGRRHSQYSTYLESTPNQQHRIDFNPPGNFQSRNSQTLMQCYYSLADSCKDGATRNRDTTTTNTVSITEKDLPVSSEPLNVKKQSDIPSQETPTTPDIAAVKSEFHSPCHFTTSVAGSTVTTISDSSAAFLCSKHNQEKRQPETYVISDLLRDIKVERTENAQNRGAFIPFTEHKQNAEAQSKINCAKGRCSSVYRFLQRTIACIPLISPDKTG